MAPDIIKRWKASAYSVNFSTALTIYPCQMPVHRRWQLPTARKRSGGRPQRTVHPRRLPINTVIKITLVGLELTTFRLLVRRAATSSATDSPSANQMSMKLKQLTGEDESDDTEDETATPRDDAGHDDVTSKRLDVTDEERALMTLLTRDHDDLLLLLLLGRWHSPVPGRRIARTHRMSVRRRSVRVVHGRAGVLRLVRRRIRCVGRTVRLRLRSGTFFHVKQLGLTVRHVRGTGVFCVTWRSGVRIPSWIHVASSCLQNKIIHDDWRWTIELSSCCGQSTCTISYLLMELVFVWEGSF